MRWRVVLIAPRKGLALLHAWRNGSGLIYRAFVGWEVEAFAGGSVHFVGVGVGEFDFDLAFAAEGVEHVFDFQFEQFEGLLGGELRFPLDPIGVFVGFVQGVE